MPDEIVTATGAAGVRPRWSGWGGGGLLVGALALLAATILEYFVWQTTELVTGVFVAFSVLFFANIAIYVVAMFALAFAGGGIVGSSVIGKLGFVLFGVGWAAQQVIYWSNYFVYPFPTALSVLYTVVLVLTYLGAVAAAVVVALGRVVRGLARWALLIGFVVAAVCAGVAKVWPDDLVLRTVLMSISCLAHGFVGLRYLRSRLAAEA